MMKTDDFCYFPFFLFYSLNFSTEEERRKEERKKWKSATSVPRGSSICKTRIFLSERMKERKTKKRKKEEKKEKRKEKERIEIHFPPARQKSRGGILIFYQNLDKLFFFFIRIILSYS